MPWRDARRAMCGKTAWGEPLALMATTPLMPLSLQAHPHSRVELRGCVVFTRTGRTRTPMSGELAPYHCSGALCDVTVADRFGLPHLLLPVSETSHVSWQVETGLPHSIGKEKTLSEN